MSAKYASKNSQGNSLKYVLQPCESKGKQNFANLDLILGWQAG